jgi:NAD+ synthase (glutamine-hydrolysing)
VPEIRIALAQINSTVGDLDGNSDLILAAAAAAAKLGAKLVAFPEMALTGYPIEDLALRRSFQLAASVATVSLASRLVDAGLGDLTVVVGVLASRGPLPQNAAAVLRAGRVTDIYVKHHLPNYGVFDERRLFTAGDEPCVIEVSGVRFSIAICEDLWQPGSPAELAAKADADVLLVINASPYEQGKDDARLELCRERALQTGCPVAYVNAYGGQDELVFDGGSVVVRPDGSIAASAPQFEPALLMADFVAGDFVDGSSVVNLSDIEEVYRALVLGLRDYVRKNNQTSVVLGVSGGIDSALVAAIACDALGSDNVYGVAMPSAYSSGHSVEDALELAERTGLQVRTVSIAPMFDAYQTVLRLTGLAEENLQARIRGATLMAVSNSEGHLVLATGNKSELAVGYSTIYGDAVGGFGPIKDVPKTLVWELSRWRNQLAESQGKTMPIPPRSIEKPPSAELRPDQLDTDSLPDYAELDAVLEAYVEGQAGVAGLIGRGFDGDLALRVMSMTDGAEYKRRQYPPGTKITRLAFGRDRRLPITNRWKEPSEDAATT